jgi:hypothetical protein
VILVLSVPSAEVRMRVFELLTALCVYSQDGYELVLKSLQDFQVNINFTIDLKEGKTKRKYFRKSNYQERYI